MSIGEFVSPMLAGEIRNVRRWFTWLPVEMSVQAKHDGIRLQVHKKGNRVWLFTRGGIDVTDNLPEIVQSVQRLPQDFILDGEAVSFVNNVINFNAMMCRLRGGEGKATFYAFDVLNLNGYDITHQSYYGRRDALDKMDVLSTPNVITDDPEEVRALYIQALKNGFEGVVLREVNSPYEIGKRGLALRKLKPLRTIDVQVVSKEQVKAGYTTYTVAVKEGIIARFATRARLNDGQIVEMKHEGFIQSAKYPLGKTVRFPKLFRFRPDLKQPNSLHHETEIPA